MRVGRRAQEYIFLKSWRIHPNSKKKCYSFAQVKIFLIAIALFVDSRKNSSSKYFSLCLHIDTVSITYNLGHCGTPKHVPSWAGLCVPASNKIARSESSEVNTFSDNEYIFCSGIPWLLPSWISNCGTWVLFWQVLYIFMSKCMFMSLIMESWPLGLCLWTSLSL